MMIKFLNPAEIPQLISPFFPMAVKTPIVITSTTLAVAGLATSYFSKDPVVAGFSVILLITNVVTWLDLGSSEKVKGYEESFKREGVKEKIEGKTIAELESTLKEAQENLLTLKSDSELIGVENARLQEILKSSQAELEPLKKASQETSSIIESLEHEISGYQEKIKDLKNMELSQREEIHTSKTLAEKAGALIRRMEIVISNQKKQLEDRDQEISTLKGRVSLLTRHSEV